MFRGVWLRILFIQKIFEVHKVPFKWEREMLFIASKLFKVQLVAISLAGMAGTLVSLFLT